MNFRDLYESLTAREQRALRWSAAATAVALWLSTAWADPRFLLGIPLAALFLFAFTLIFGTPAAYPLFGGFIAGYLLYDYTHYYVHHFVPKSDLGKRLREQHMRHHFQDHRYGYGVSSPLWDVVFRTLPRRRRS